MQRISLVALALCLSLATAAVAADWGLKEGSPEIKSAGPLAFGPDGVLLVGDTKSATLFAIDTKDTKGDPGKVDLNVESLPAKVAEALGVPANEVKLNDLAVNPETGRVFLSVAQGSGPNATPAIVRVDESGKLTPINLKKVAFSKVVLPNPPEDKITGEGPRARNQRDSSITDLAYVNGKVIVSGMSTNAAPSTVREIQFPFTEADQGASIEIYHAAHGKTEDYAAIRTFVPFNVDGEPALLAGFVCTPLVKFPLDSLKAGQKAKGTTVAELGNRNQPLDMIAYKKNGKDYLLLTNSARGVMKISTEGIANNKGITEPVKGGGTAGQEYETIKDLQGVVQLDKLDDNRAIILVQADGGAANLKTIQLP